MYKFRDKRWNTGIKMARLDWIDSNKSLAIYLAAAIYLFFNNTLNASTVWLEGTRNDDPSFAMWEPFVWEYSSALAVLLLLPALFHLLKLMPLSANNLKKQLLVHLIGTLVFSLLHVGLMVSFRELAYFLAGQNYDFGPLARELWYEYRKDAWGYIIWLLIYTLVGMAYSRLKGEASPISFNEEEHSRDGVAPAHFIVKKLDREFLVKVSDIEWLESSGNYVNLHSKGRIYPLRSTLAQLNSRLAAVGFSRIHRSFGVNHNFIDNISYQSSGDGEIVLRSGKKLPLSRRYKDEFKQSLS